VARLPQPSVGPVASLAIELEVDTSTSAVVSAATNLPLPGLTRLIQDVLTGRTVAEVEGVALLELEVRYAAPFASALRSAVRAAAKRAQADLARPCLRAKNGANGHGDMVLDGPVTGLSQSSLN
jgi:hypothetical protein